MTVVKTSRTWAIASVVLFAFACATPVFRDRGAGPGRMYGWQLLWLGWMYLGLNPWLANPLGLLALIFHVRGRRRSARILALVAAAVAALMWLPMLGSDPLLIGYYLWQSSFLALAVAAHLAAEPAAPVAVDPPIIPA